MSFSLTNVTGSAITGLTSPTYTVTLDTAPDVNSKQWAVTALGGTQTGVSTHTPECPFTCTIKRPKTLRVLGAKNAVTGQYNVVPKNEYKVIVRKGGLIQTGQYDVMLADAAFRVPAGMSTQSPAEMYAFASFFGGVIAQQIQGISDTLRTGIV
jgi:hypothetical protein